MEAFYPLRNKYMNADASRVSNVFGSWSQIGNKQWKGRKGESEHSFKLVPTLFDENIAEVALLELI